MTQVPAEAATKSFKMPPLRTQGGTGRGRRSWLQSRWLWAALLVTLAVAVPVGIRWCRHAGIFSRTAKPVVAESPPAPQLPMDPALDEQDELVADAAASPPVPLSQELPAASVFDWPQWRGPARDGRSREVDLLTHWSGNGPSKLWERPSGPGFSSLAVARDRVVTLTRDARCEAVVCWHATTGQELWRYRYPCKYPENLVYRSGPRTTPTVEGEFVYTVGAVGWISCMELAPPTSAGKVVWRKNLARELHAPPTHCGHCYSPLIEGDLLITMPGGVPSEGKTGFFPPESAAAQQACIVALDKKTGAVRWKSLNDHPGYSSPMAADLAGRRQLVFLTGRAAVGLDPATGGELWRFPWDTFNGGNVATPIVQDDHVFISASYDQGCALLKIEPEGDGCKARLVYKNSKMRNHFSTCVLHKGHLYGFNEAILTCMDFMTGKVLWKQNGFGKGSLLIADDHLMVLGEQGTLVVAAASPNGFQQTAELPLFSTPSLTVPVVANGRLYVRNEEKLVCFDLHGH